MVDIAQVSFAKGEISPIAADRTDQQFYASALQSCVNFLIHAEGGASNRPGLQFIGKCLSNTPNGSYLLPFIYNNQQTYICEFSAGSIDFYSNGVFVQNLSTAAAITNVAITGTPGAFTLTFTAVNTFAAGQQVTVSGVVLAPGIFNVNVNQVWTIQSATATQFIVALPATGPITLTYVSGGIATVPLILSNPYALADLPSLRWAQSADVLNVVVSTQPLYQLTRLTVNSFSLTSPQLLFGPFQDINTDGTTTVYASGTQGNVTLTASAPIFKPGHVGALFYLEEQFLNSIAPWEAQKIIAYPNGSTPVGMYIRSDGKIYVCTAALSSADHTATGTFQPVHTQGTQQDGDGLPVPNLANVVGVSWQFVSTKAGVALITQYLSPTQVKATVQSSKGIYSNFPPSVVGGPQTAHGPWTFSGTGSQTSFTPLTGVTTSDANQFYVTVNGIFQDPGTYSVNIVNIPIPPLSAGTITFLSPPPAGTNNVSVAQVTGTLANTYSTPSSATPQLMMGLCLSTYWAFGSISPVQGYASDVCYYNDRLVLAGTPQQPQTLWTSRVSDYLNFNVSDPQVDSDAITETINSRQQNPINNLLPMNNLLLGTASASWRATDSSGIGAITPANIALIPQEFYGMQDVAAVQTGTTIIYVQWGGRKLRDIIYQFYNDKFLGKELTVFARQMFPAGTSISRLAFAPEPYGLIYCVRSDGVLCVCSYLPEQEVIAWARWTTQGNFEDVCVVPENDTFSVYVIVGRTINGSYQRFIERFAPREFADIDDAFFVDSGLTYDGRNTSPTTMTVSGGTTWLANDSGTLTASSASGWTGFNANDAPQSNAIWLTDDEGNLLCRLLITAVTTTQVASVRFLDPVPAALQGIATDDWTFARTFLTGLTNLPGQTVSVFADGSVQPQQVVSALGSITLPNAGGVVHAGLPYTSQLQSLNLNLQGQESIRNRMKTIPRVSVVVDASYPFLMGPDFEHLLPVVQRQFEPYNQPIAPHTGVLSVQLQTEPQDDAYVCAQMSDPAPVRILGWLAQVDVGESQ